MAEYIEREKVIEVLENALAFSENSLNLGEFRQGCIAAISDDIKEVSNLPTADVVEVVRCEECKYKEDCARQMVHTTRDYMLEQNISSYNRVDFCSYGEKRSDTE